MEPVILFAKGPFTTLFRRSFFAFAALVFLLPLAVRAEPTLGPNIFPEANFDDPNPTYIPWAGVDASNNIHGLGGSQLAAGESGRLASYNFGPSVAVGDLRGKGVQDLVLADTRGYFWYFPNSGTANKPAFTQGEVMPIWLSDERLTEHTENVSSAVPRIQLVDFDGSKKLDLLAGTYSGKLYRIPNLGSASGPLFKPTMERDQLLINTHKGGILWNNYMSPFLTTAFSRSNMLDLVAGEGTYSANSIYLLHNTNSSGHPEYNEDRMTKIIAGMGKEQLTPVVFDWNGDGKPDVLCGDRTGFLTLYLNTSTDPDTPTFDSGNHIKIGGLEKLGGATTIALADLTGNGLPNLLIGRDDGTILSAINNGKLGAPDFSKAATPLKGVLPPAYHYIASKNWGGMAGLRPTLRTRFLRQPAGATGLHFSSWSDLPLRVEILGFPVPKYLLSPRLLCHQGGRVETAPDLVWKDFHCENEHELQASFLGQVGGKSRQSTVSPKGIAQ